MTTQHKIVSLPAARCIVVVLAMAGSLSGKVLMDFDPDCDFSRFKTYSFVRGIELEKTGVLKDPETRERIKNFIAGGLDPRGLKEVPQDEHHDLVIRYWVALRSKQDVTVDLADPMWMGWGGYPPYWNGMWAYGYETYIIRNYREGTLIVDLIDPTTKQLVWRTFFQQDLSDRVKAYANLKKDLAKTFAKFPPSKQDLEKMQDQRKKQASKDK